MRKIFLTLTFSILLSQLAAADLTATMREITDIYQQLDQRLQAGQSDASSQSLAQRLSKLSQQARGETPAGMPAAKSGSFHKQVDFMSHQLLQVEQAVKAGDSESAQLYLHTLAPWTKPGHFSAKQ